MYPAVIIAAIISIVFLIAADLYAITKKEY
jgi:hypothetical protein